VVAAKTKPQRLVREDQIIDGWQTPLQIVEGAGDGGRRQAADHDHLRDPGAVHLEAGARAESGARRDHDLDRRGIHVEAMKPGGGSAGESCELRLQRAKHLPGVLAP